MRHIPISAVGLALLGVACSRDASRGLTGPEDLSPAGALSGIMSTHPAGNIVNSPPLGGKPFGVDVSSGNVAYITQLDSASMRRADLPSTGFTGTVAVGPTPTGTAFHPAGNTGWVTNQNDDQPSSTVGVVDVSTNTQVRTIPITGNVFVGIAKPDGGTIYVSTNTGDVYAINAVTDQVLAMGDLGAIVNGFAFHPDGVRLYASQISGGTVKEINTETNTVTRTFSTGGTKLQGIVVSRDGSELYVADEGANVLRVVNITSGLQTDSVLLGGGGFGVALTQDNVQVYVGLPAGGAGCTSGGCVKVIDRASRSVVDTIQTGGKPRRMAFSVAGETAVIADESGKVHFVK